MTTQEQILFPHTAGLTEDEQAVWDIVRRRRRENPIKKATLSGRVGIHERRVRGILKRLIEVHRPRIGSASTHPHGYFLIVTRAEAAEVCEREYRRALSILYKKSILARVSNRDIGNQVALDLQEKF